MEHSTEVKSSTISHIGYNDETHEMQITFNHGGTYSYQGISPETHQGLITAESVGKHFHANIRPHFTGTKLQPKASPELETAPS